ncbi:hypothetical protein ACJJTC_006836 [Scirpophaga incertulas]
MPILRVVTRALTLHQNQSVLEVCLDRYIDHLHSDTEPRWDPATGCLEHDGPRFVESHVQAQEADASDHQRRGDRRTVDHLLPGFVPRRDQCVVGEADILKYFSNYT